MPGDARALVTQFAADWQAVLDAQGQPARSDAADAHARTMRACADALPAVLDEREALSSVVRALPHCYDCAALARYVDAAGVYHCEAPPVEATRLPWADAIDALPPAVAESVAMMPSTETTAAGDRAVHEQLDLAATRARLAHVEGLVARLVVAWDTSIPLALDAVQALRAYHPTSPLPPDPRDAEVAGLREVVRVLAAADVVVSSGGGWTIRGRLRGDGRHPSEDWRHTLPEALGVSRRPDLAAVVARALTLQTPATPPTRPSSARDAPGCPDGLGGDGDAPSEPVAPSASAAPGADVPGDLPVRVRRPDRPGECEDHYDHHDHGSHDRGHAREQGEQVQAQGDHGEGHEDGEHRGRVGRGTGGGKPAS